MRGFQCLIGAGAVAASLPAGGRRDGETVDDEAGHGGLLWIKGDDLKGTSVAFALN